MVRALVRYGMVPNWVEGYSVEASFMQIQAHQLYQVPHLQEVKVQIRHSTHCQPPSSTFAALLGHWIGKNALMFLCSYEPGTGWGPICTLKSINEYQCRTLCIVGVWAFGCHFAHKER